jgi:hypothetical protein
MTELDKLFPATAPAGVDVVKYEAVRSAGRAFAEALLVNAPKTGKNQASKLGDAFKAAVKELMPKSTKK